MFLILRIALTNNKWMKVCPVLWGVAHPSHHYHLQTKFEGATRRSIRSLFTTEMISALRFFASHCFAVLHSE